MNNTKELQLTSHNMVNSFVSCSYCGALVKKDGYARDKALRLNRKLYCNNNCFMSAKNIRIECNYCKKTIIKPAWKIRQSKKQGRNIYCSKICSSNGQKFTKEHKAELYRQRSAKWRRENPQRYRDTRLAWRLNNKEKINSRIREKRRNNQDFREKLNIADKKHRAKKQYGVFWECKFLIDQLNQIIKERTL